jgi:hypothetical protein
MGIVTLEITRPRDGQRFVDPQPVRLRGRVVSDPAGTEGPLHFRWYSSLQAGASDEPDPDIDSAQDAPLNGAADDPLDFERVLWLGTHVLTLTAKDVPGDEQEDLEAVTRAGITGGPDPDASPCVVTVLHADILELEPEPARPRPVLAGAVTLTARAPARWGEDVSQPDEPPRYEPDAGYHERNTVGYRWELVPDGTHQPAETWEAGVDELEFDLDERGGAGQTGPPRVRLQRELPAGLSGRHTLVLSVFDTSDPEGPRSTVSMEVDVDH